MCELLTSSEGAQLATLVACGEASMLSCWADVPSCQLCFKQLHKQCLEVTSSLPSSSTQEGRSLAELLGFDLELLPF